MLNRESIKRIGLWLIGVALFASVSALGTLWWRHNRDVTLPAPDGPYRVGRVQYDWTDTSRPDPLTGTTSQARTLNVWIWYPAEQLTSSTPPAPYLPQAWIAARERAFGVGALLMQNFAHVHGHSLAEAPLATDQHAYPMIVMQPGLGPILPDYTTLAEALASHGYIVVGSTPTGSASIVVFNNGQVVSGTPQGNVPETATITETQQILGNLIQVWGQDDRFVVDQMAQLNKADPADRFTGRINLDAIGVFGHSFGGATAAQFCRLDSRCKAGVDLDGYLYGDVVQVGLHQPFLFFWSEPTDPNDTTWQHAIHDADTLYQHLPPGSMRATMKGTRHFNFSDYAVEFAPIIRLQNGLGSIDGARGLQITAAYVRVFFDTTLRHQDSHILDAISSMYPEVQLEQR